jgi:hypothetical protein
MPLFIFMCGAAVPFALERRLKEGKCVFWRHVLWRPGHAFVAQGKDGVKQEERSHA